MTGTILSGKVCGVAVINHVKPTLNILILRTTLVPALADWRSSAPVVKIMALKGGAPWRGQVANGFRRIFGMR